ncbi:hypothetical protein ES705_48692 [subsurface metagenome]
MPQEIFIPLPNRKAKVLVVYLLKDRFAIRSTKSRPRIILKPAKDGKMLYRPDDTKLGKWIKRIARKCT